MLTKEDEVYNGWTIRTYQAAFGLWNAEYSRAGEAPSQYNFVKGHKRKFKAIYEAKKKIDEITDKEQRKKNVR